MSINCYTAQGENIIDFTLQHIPLCCSYFVYVYRVVTWNEFVVYLTVQSASSKLERDTVFRDPFGSLPFVKAFGVPELQDSMRNNLYAEHNKSTRRYKIPRAVWRDQLNAACLPAYAHAPRVPETRRTRERASLRHAHGGSEQETVFLPTDRSTARAVVSTETLKRGGPRSRDDWIAYREQSSRV